MLLDLYVVADERMDLLVVYDLLVVLEECALKPKQRHPY